MDISKHEVTAPKYQINIKDALRGLLIAAGTAAGFIIQSTVESGSLDINWKKVGMAALAGGLTYIIKNYFTPAVVKVPLSDVEAQAAKDAGEPITNKTPI